MINIFLSASIPLPGRHPKFLETADLVAIRDSIKSLVQTCLPHARIVFGGHPAITPLISVMLKQMSLDFKRRVTLYQSKFFETDFIKENDEFIDLKLTEVVYKNNEKDMGASLAKMRERMITDTNFDAAVFIGGMEGIKDEYLLFHKKHPKALIFPVASTGAASLMLYEELKDELNNPDLQNKLSYPILFEKMLKKILGQN